MLNTEELRDYAGNNGYSHADYADTMTQAADEIDGLRNRMKDMEEFEKWLRTVCFQKPTPESYNLAKESWQKSKELERERINATEYPGTRQLCYVCDKPTGRCEEDSIYLPPMNPDANGIGPLCEECAEEMLSAANEASRLSDGLCGCGRPIRYMTQTGVACNKYMRCLTYEELKLALAKANILLLAYRNKRAIDGLNGRTWDACKHFEAEADIEALEQTHSAK